MGVEITSGASLPGKIARAALWPLAQKQPAATVNQAGGKNHVELATASRGPRDQHMGLALGRWPEIQHGRPEPVPPAQSDAIAKFALAAVSREQVRSVLMSMAPVLIAGRDCGKRGQACQ